MMSDTKSIKTIHLAILVLLTLVFYGNTLSNGYALDDAIVITKNEFTKQGFKGIDDIFTTDAFTGFFGKQKELVSGGRYRPLSVATFALEYAFWGLKPGISHLINLLLMALTAIVLYKILDKFYPDARVSIPFLTALLFVIHPIHTEVVANVKGRDEILALLGGLAALWATIQYLLNKKITFLTLSGVFLFLGLLSKENTINFLVMIPLFTFLFFPKTKVALYLKSIAPLVLASVVFLYIRHQIIGPVQVENGPRELMNNPFVEATGTQRAGTILYTLGQYLKLLFWPHPLTYDYYPYHIPLVSLASMKAIIPLLLYVAFIFLVVLGLVKKKKWTFGLLAYLIPLGIVSNILFPVGTFMNERFIYFSSVGFSFLVAIFLINLLKIKRFSTPGYVLISILILAGAYKTIDRNKAWKDDYTLFTTDVKTSKNSAKSNCTAGGTMLEKAQTLETGQQKEVLLAQSKAYLMQSISIYPAYVDAQLLMGNVLWEIEKRFEPVERHYTIALNKYRQHPAILKNLKAMALQSDSTEQKLNIYHYLLKHWPNDFDAHYQLGNIYGKHFGDLGQATYHLKKALEIQPKQPNALKDMGVAMGISGKFRESIQYFEQALEQDPNDKQLLMNIGVSYQRLGEIEKAAAYFEKAKE